MLWSQLRGISRLPDGMHSERMLTTYVYIFESGELAQGVREPNDAELECCDLGILTLLRIELGPDGLIIKSLRGDELRGQRTWEPVQHCQYRADDNDRR